MQDALSRIADLAPTLSHTEVRVLLEMSRRVVTTGNTSLTISARKFAKQTNLSYSNTRAALAHLNERGIITSDNRHASDGATHRLNFLETVPLEPAPKFSAGVGLSSAQGAPNFGAQVVRISAQGASNFGAPEPAANDAGARAPTFEDFDSIKPDIDRWAQRLRTARPADYDAAMIERAKNAMQSYMAKYGANQQPPDETICAQFIAIAEWPRLEGMLFDLMAERRKAGYNYAWFISVAPQRMWGISYKTLRGRDEAQRKPPQLFHSQPRAMAAAAASSATGATPPPNATHPPDIAAAIAQAAHRKAMR